MVERESRPAATLPTNDLGYLGMVIQQVTRDLFVGYTKVAKDARVKGLKLFDVATLLFQRHPKYGWSEKHVLFSLWSHPARRRCFPQAW